MKSNYVSLIGSRVHKGSALPKLIWLEGDDAFWVMGALRLTLLLLASSFINISDSLHYAAMASILTILPLV